MGRDNNINDLMQCLTAQWEILSTFGSLQNPDFIQILGPQKVDFWNFAGIFNEFSNLGAKKYKSNFFLINIKPVKTRFDAI